jgi:hypothetical protein
MICTKLHNRLSLAKPDGAVAQSGKQADARQGRVLRTLEPAGSHSDLEVTNPEDGMLAPWFSGARKSAPLPRR